MLALAGLKISEEAEDHRSHVREWGEESYQFSMAYSKSNFANKIHLYIPYPLLT